MMQPRKLDHAVAATRLPGAAHGGVVSTEHPLHRQYTGMLYQRMMSFNLAPPPWIGVALGAERPERESDRREGRVAKRGGVGIAVRTQVSHD